MLFFHQGINCGEPFIVEYSHREVEGHNFNESSAYSCHTGYKMNGPPKSVCQADKHWSVPPECNSKLAIS